VSEVTLKSEEELRLMREAGRLLGLVFGHLDQRIALGVSTMAIRVIVKSGGWRSGGSPV